MKTNIKQLFLKNKTTTLHELGVDDLSELSTIENVSDLEEVKSIIKLDKSLTDVERNEVYKIIISSGAFLKGHFELLSKKHSEYFIRFSKISRNIKNLKYIANIICQKIIKSAIDIDTILSPETAGGTLGTVVSELLVKNNYKSEICMIYAKTDEGRKPTSLINFIDLNEDARILIVNDMISTGYGIEQLIELTKKYNRSQVEGICVFSIRTNRESIRNLTTNRYFYALSDSSSLETYTYEKENCKLCSEKKPIKSKFLN